MMKFETLILMVLCHLLGDYVLQSDYIATTKGRNYYHLFVHSALYCLPFMFFIGITYNVLFQLFITHFFIDAGKARFRTIGYVRDQLLHYFVIFMLWPEVIGYVG